MILNSELDPLRMQSMPPFYATAHDAWYNMAPTINTNIQSIEALRGMFMEIYPLNTSGFWHFPYT
jgi:hypothetical protein